MPSTYAALEMQLIIIQMYPAFRLEILSLAALSDPTLDMAC